MKTINPKTPSPHSWLIMLMIIATMGVFLFILVSTVAIAPPPSSTTSDGTITTTTMSPSTLHPDKSATSTMTMMDGALQTKSSVDTIHSSSHHILYDNQTNTPISHTKLIHLSNEWVRHYLSSLPSTVYPPSHSGAPTTVVAPSSSSSPSWKLGATPVLSIQIVPSQFFIYDTKAVFDAKTSSYLLTLLMELPPIRIFVSTIYSKYYPEINPYIHTVELTYSWKLQQATGALLPSMTLVSMKLSTVAWETNRYHMMYVQTKNSPLCLPDMMPPLPFKEEELKTFLLNTELFSIINANTLSAVNLASKPISSPTKTILQ